jgi:hypothetical protein
MPIELNDVIAETIKTAPGRGVPLAVAYVDPDGLPKLSVRGTVQVVGPDQLGLWTRPGGGMPDALAANPNVSLLYEDLANINILMFTGRGRVVDDQAFRDQVFDGSPANEQARDAERAGQAILIELDTVRGRLGEGMLMMSRG